MKALLLSSIYPSQEKPTHGTFNHNVFRALSAHCEVRVISPRPFWTRLKQPNSLFRAPRETQTGLETFLPTYWSVPKATGLHARGLYASLRPLVARMRQEGFAFDVVFAAWAYPDAVAASYIARDYGCPLMVKILGSDINHLAQLPALRPQIKAGLERAGRIITVSDALRERVIELGIEPVRVVTQHNGVDGSKFVLRDKKEARRAMNLPPERTNLCFVGRLGHEKGIDVLLQAMGKLWQSGRRDIDLHLVGGGEMEEPLRAQAANLQIQSVVHFHGMRPHKEIAQWISACDVLCLPSRREGCPNVVLEALASGRPVVASRVGGLPELIHDGNGILVPADDAPALANGLRDALQHNWNEQDLRNSVEYLSWDEVGAKYYQTMVTVWEEWQAASSVAQNGGLSSPLPNITGP